VLEGSSAKLEEGDRRCVRSTIRETMQPAQVSLWLGRETALKDEQGD
jgi:hypothetical protein